MGKEMILTRAYKGKDETLGILQIDGLPPIYTLERPWKNNEQNISCIPPGTYQCSPYSSAKFQNVYILKDVPGRSSILIHSGNTVADCTGCILVGLNAGDLEGGPAVLKSTSAMNLIRDYIGKEDFTLTIR